MNLVPDLAELVALRADAQGLNLRAHRAALAHLRGDHRSAQRGRGIELEEVRLYAAGDDTRSIDWRVTARRGRPHTKVFREDRERPVWLLVDLHPGLYFGSKRQLKSALLLRAASLLAWTAALSGDRVGAVVSGGFRGSPQILPPRSRDAGVLPLLEALINAQPHGPGVSDPSHLTTALVTLRSIIKPGSMVLLLSDFSGMDTDAEVSLAAVAARADCRLLWITDPLETTGLPAGDYRVGLPGRLWWLNGERSRESWRAAWSACESRLIGLARKLNIPLTRLSTPYPVSDVLPALLREPTWAA